MNRSKRKDFFISFNKADRLWGEWIAWTLEDIGYSVLFQNWDFTGNFVLEMQRGLDATERMIAILSPDYLSSAFTAPEWAARFAQDPTGAKDLLIPVRVRDCQPTGLLASVIYVDLVDIESNQARERIQSRVKRMRVKPSLQLGFPGRLSNEPLFPLAETTRISASKGRKVATKRLFYSAIIVLGVFVSLATYAYFYSATSPHYPEIQPKLGLSLAPLTIDASKQLELDPSTKGVLVTEVSPNSRAESSGMNPGDIIVRVNKEEVFNPRQIAEAIKEAYIKGERGIFMIVIQDGKTNRISISF